MNIRAPAPLARGATGIPVNRQSLASRRAFFSSFFAIAAALICISLASNTAQAQTIQPQGRLTLQSGTPVMNADVSNTSTVYYVPYQGDLAPIDSANGGSFSNYSLGNTGLTLTLSSTYQTSGKIYDVFLFLNSGVVTIGFNTTPWPSLTGRGTGCAELEINTPIWVNGSTFNGPDGCTLNNGSTVYQNVGAGQATYVGSVYMTGNGQTSVQFKPTPAAGGTNNVIGIWNAYNRVPAHSLNRDSTYSWTQTNASGWQVADPGSSSANKITWLDGLQATSLAARFTVLPEASSIPAAAVIGINLDSTTATPDLTADYYFDTGALFSQLDVAETFTPQLGLHYVQAMEYVNFTGSITFYGAPSFAYEALSLDFDY